MARAAYLIAPGIAGDDWFIACGTALTDATIAEAREYLAAAGCSDAIAIVGVASWREAERIVRDPAWDATVWEREEETRVALLERARGALGAGTMLERLTAATELVPDALYRAAERAAQRDGHNDAGMVRSAAGAAAMALHAAALARLAGCGSDHVFMRKCRLFEAGRWPLVVLRGAFHLF